MSFYELNPEITRNSSSITPEELRVLAARAAAIDSIGEVRALASQIDLPGAVTEPEAIPAEVMAQWAETDKKIRTTQGFKGEPFTITGIIESKEQ